MSYKKKNFSLRSSRTKSMRQYQEIEKIWPGQENSEISFCVIFDH